MRRMFGRSPSTTLYPHCDQHPLHVEGADWTSFTTYEGRAGKGHVTAVLRPVTSVVGFAISDLHDRLPCLAAQERLQNKPKNERKFADDEDRKRRGENLRKCSIFTL